MEPLQQILTVLEEIDHLQKISPHDCAVKLSPIATRLSKIESSKLTDILRKLSSENVIEWIKVPNWDNLFVVLGGRFDASSILAEIKVLPKFESYFEDLKNQNKNAFFPKQNSDTSLVVEYSEQTREIILNKIFLLARPALNSENDLVFSYLFKNSGRFVSIEELEKNATKAPIKKRLHEILRDIGFSHDFLKAFFIVQKQGIQFNNPVSSERLKELGAEKIKITAKPHK